MIFKLATGIFLLVIGFLMGFVYGTELGRVVWEATWELIKSKF